MPGMQTAWTSGTAVCGASALLLSKRMRRAGTRRRDGQVGRAARTVWWGGAASADGAGLRGVLLGCYVLRPSRDRGSRPVSFTLRLKEPLGEQAV